MKEQPKPPLDSWEKLIKRLLQLYASEMFNMAKESPKSLKKNDMRRAEIRDKIVDIGKLLDQTEENYKRIINEHQTQ
jgi:hypothetical protein